MRLDGKVAVITGGAGGIGLETAKEMLRLGACVVTADLQEPQDNSLPPHEALYCKADISSDADVAALMSAAVRAFGKIDILVNNAGVAYLGASADYPESLWRKTLDINLTGAFLCCRQAVPFLRKNGGGSIVNVSSVMGLVGAPFQAAYNASKSGLLALTRCFAVEFARDNIRVNAVCPGFVETPMLLRETPEERGRLAALHPMGRLAKAREVASGIIFLASDDSSFTTGSALMVDGGYTAQ